MFSDRLKQLGGQYVLRTCEELALVRAQIPQARDGVPEALLGIQQMVHRISGSGAMLGFNAISEQAGQIERILRRADPVPSEAEWLVIMEQLQNIEAELARLPPALDVRE